MLGKTVSDDQRDWDERLPLVMTAYRASSHSSTGYTRNQLLGRKFSMPLDLVMVLTRDDTGDGEISMEEFAQRTRQQAEEIYYPNTETTPIIFFTVDKEA